MDGRTAARGRTHGRPDAPTHGRTGRTGRTEAHAQHACSHACIPARVGACARACMHTRMHARFLRRQVECHFGRIARNGRRRDQKAVH
eukprot:931293-Alexandrium_andersonii.AAC.1